MGKSKNDDRPLKIGLAASSGGHLEQLLKLQSAFSGHQIVFVTTKRMAEGSLRELGPTYVVGECNREHPLQVLRVLRKCFHIARRERFDVVVSTGAAPGLLLCMAAKALGAKVIWIDSIANVQNLSLSGRLVRPFADLRLTQWEHVARESPGVEYVGAVI